MELVKRADKITYLKVEETYQRMKGFKALNTTRDPMEYERQYVDEDFERVDVVGINTAKDFEFDQIKDDAVHELLVDIIENEKIGKDAVVSLVTVDFTGGEAAGGYPAIERKFTVIADSEGDEFEAYTFTGTFRAQDKAVFGTAETTDDKAEEVTFTAAIG